jgi:Zn finger protein HypA/HybF involved in hydrogenase expression
VLNETHIEKRGHKIEVTFHVMKVGSCYCGFVNVHSVSFHFQVCTEHSTVMWANLVIKTFTAEWLLCVPPGLTVGNCISHTHRICICFDEFQNKQHLFPFTDWFL